MRSPGADAGRGHPRGELADPRRHRGQLTTLPATDITGLVSCARRSSADHRVSPLTSEGGEAGGAGRAADVRSPSQEATASAYCGASSVTRCEAPSKRCSRACGSRSCRSARYRSPKTGSRGPQNSSAGTSSRRTPSASSATVSYEGWPGENGMSATKSPTARRRSALP